MPMTTRRWRVKLLRVTIARSLRRQAEAIPKPGPKVSDACRRLLVTLQITRAPSQEGLPRNIGFIKAYMKTLVFMIVYVYIRFVVGFALPPFLFAPFSILVCPSSIHFWFCGSSCPAA